MTLTPEEERWLAQARRAAQPSVAYAVFWALLSASSFYLAFHVTADWQRADGRVVLSGGAFQLFVALFQAYIALRSLFPRPSERLLVSLVERLRSNAGEPNPALERTPTGGDAGSASCVRPRQ